MHIAVKGNYNLIKIYYILTKSRKQMIIGIPLEINI